MINKLYKLFYKQIQMYYECFKQRVTGWQDHGKYIISIFFKE